MSYIGYIGSLSSIGYLCVGVWLGAKSRGMNMIISISHFGYPGSGFRFHHHSVHGEWFGSAPASSCPLGRHHAFSFAFFAHSLHSPPSWVTWDGLVHMGCHSSSLTSELRNAGRCQAEPIVTRYLAISLVLCGSKMNINNAYAGFGKYVMLFWVQSNRATWYLVRTVRSLGAATLHSQLAACSVVELLTWSR